MSAVLIVVLVLVLIGAVGSSSRFGYGPTGLVSLVLVVVIVLLLTGHI